MAVVIYFGLLVSGQVFCFQGSSKFTSLIHVAEVNMSSDCDVVGRSVLLRAVTGELVVSELFDLPNLGNSQYELQTFNDIRFVDGFTGFPIFPTVFSIILSLRMGG